MKEMIKQYWGIVAAFVVGFALLGVNFVQPQDVAASGYAFSNYQNGNGSTTTPPHGECELFPVSVNIKNNTGTYKSVWVGFNIREQSGGSYVPATHAALDLFGVMGVAGVPIRWENKLYKEYVSIPAGETITLDARLFMTHGGVNYRISPFVYDDWNTSGTWYFDTYHEFYITDDYPDDCEAPGYDNSFSGYVVDATKMTSQGRDVLLEDYSAVPATVDVCQNLRVRGNVVVQKVGSDNFTGSMFIKPHPNATVLNAGGGTLNGGSYEYPLTITSSSTTYKNVIFEFQSPGDYTFNTVNGLVKTLQWTPFMDYDRIPYSTNPTKVIHVANIAGSPACGS